jgi:phosphohistidine phosphatase SixA
MLQLYFLRHAKTDWDSCDGNDFNRNISEKGVRETKKIG